MYAVNVIEMIRIEYRASSKEINIRISQLTDIVVSFGLYALNIYFLSNNRPVIASFSKFFEVNQQLVVMSVTLR